MNTSGWLVTAIRIAACSALLAAQTSGAGGDEETPPQEYYRVVNGKVDRATYTGWQVFRENCSRCHGDGAAGSAVAPSLVDRIRSLSIAQFRAKVLSRYFVTVPVQDAVSEESEAAREAMQEAVEAQQQREQAPVKMPPWRENPDVREHIAELYAYLTARADGVIGPEPPQLMEQ